MGFLAQGSNHMLMTYLQNRLVYTERPHEEVDNKVLHLVMSLSTKCGISFQTARAFALILATSLLVTYLDVRMWDMSNCSNMASTRG